MKFPCPLCHKILRVDDKEAGRRARCPHCKHSFTIPAAPVRAMFAPPKPPVPIKPRIEITMNDPNEIHSSGPWSEMFLAYPCPYCGVKMKVRRKSGMAPVECPHCHQIFTLPSRNTGIAAIIIGLTVLAALAIFGYWFASGFFNTFFGW